MEPARSVTAHNIMPVPKATNICPIRNIGSAPESPFKQCMRPKISDDIIAANIGPLNSRKPRNKYPRNNISSLMPTNSDAPIHRIALCGLAIILGIANPSGVNMTSHRGPAIHIQELLLILFHPAWLVFFEPDRSRNKGDRQNRLFDEKSQISYGVSVKLTDHEKV